MRSRPLAGRLSSFAAVATVVVGALAALASSASAQAACPNADVRAQQRSEFLPDCRAYEMVSAADKEGGSVDVGDNVGVNRASVDGNAFVYVSWANFADAMGAMPVSYRARRTADGWRSEAVSPAPAHPSASAIDGHLALWSQMASDLSVGFVLTKDSFDPTDVSVDPEGKPDIYRTGPGQQTELISRGNGAERTGPDRRAVFSTGASDATRSVSNDGRHVLFDSTANLVPADASRHFLDSDGNVIMDVYDRVDGETHLVNVDSDENLINPCGSVLGDGGSARERAISADGSRVVFQTPGYPNYGLPPLGLAGCGEPTQVYVRVDNEETVRVSASQRTDCATQDPCTGVPDPDAEGTDDATYIGSSVDGRYVFFRSHELLTDDATRQFGDLNNGGLYRYDMETGELKLFQTGTTAMPFISRVSADGSTVYFVSYLAYTPDATFALYNFYAKRGNEIKHVATQQDSTTPDLAYLGELSRRAIATPDGKRFLFTSASVLGSYDHSGHTAVYLYDFESDELTCVSCDPAGQRPADSSVSTNASFDGAPHVTPPISADGETVVFESGDRLVAQDVNSARDVYRYRDGGLELITPGRGQTNSKLIGMDPSGESVFFVTGEKLVGADGDGNVDVYVARAGGGFLEAESLEPEAECVGDGCQPPSAGTLDAPLAGSLTFRGLGDLDTPAAARLSVARVGSARGGVARLRVRVPRGGRIVLSGPGVRGVQRRAGRAASYDVRVALSMGARRTLGRKGVLRVRVTIRFRPTEGVTASKTLRLVFRERIRRGASRQAGVVPSTTLREGR